MRTRNAILLLNLVTLVYSNISEVYEDFLSKPQYQLYFTEEKWSEKTVDLKRENGSSIIKLPVNKEGITYACEIEKPKLRKKLTKEEDEQLKVEKALEQLEPLGLNPCVTYVQEWWSYEFCYKKHITQFHKAKENDPPEHNMDFFLGKYPDQEELKNPDSKYQKETYHFGPLGNNYISQMLVNGTMCDITNAPRKAEIRYYCADSEGIVAVKEISTCNYMVMFNTPRICNGPGFEKNKSINSILCHPITKVENEDNLNEGQPKEIPFPIFYKKKSVVELEKAKLRPKKIFKSKHSKKGTKVKEGVNAQNQKDESSKIISDESSNSNNIYDYKNTNEEDSDTKNSQEENEFKKTREDFLDALLPYASELKNVDENVLDEILIQLADTLASAIELEEQEKKKKEKEKKEKEGTNNNGEDKGEKEEDTENESEKIKKKIEIVDLKVINKEKLKSWIEASGKNLASDDVKMQVVIMDDKGNKREVSNTETDIDSVMEFLKQYSTGEASDFSFSQVKKENIEEIGVDGEDTASSSSSNEVKKENQEQSEKNKKKLPKEEL